VCGRHTHASTLELARKNGILTAFGFSVVRHNGVEKMVATGGLFLLFLVSSRYDFRPTYSRSVRDCRISIFGLKASSSSEEPRRQTNWENNLSLLKRFKEREGHCNVPRSHREDGAPLGRWVATQRYTKSLDSDRIQSLEEVGLLWNGFQSNQQRYFIKWEEHLALLEKFLIREGHCNAPASHKEEGFNLGSWVVTQRILHKKGKLHPDRQKRLEEIGFVIQPRSLRTWQESFLILETYKTREGDCKVPFKHKEDGANLGAWVATQRSVHKKGKLDPQRQLSLEEIGFVLEMQRGPRLKK
jgi:hypothetical protein